MISLLSIYGAAGAVFAVISLVPYLISIISGRTKPHIFTWILWTLLTFIVWAIQFADGAGAGAWATLVTAILSLVIVVFSFKNGHKNITKTDWEVRPGPPLNLIKKNNALRKVIAANLSAMWLLSACQTIPEETPQPTTILNPPQSTAIIEPQAIEPPANEESLETKIEIASAASVTPAVAAQHGDPMDFICASPIAPTGKLKERPNTQIMWEYFIDLEPVDVFVFIGGKVSRNRKAPDNNGTWTNH